MAAGLSVGRGCHCARGGGPIVVVDRFHLAVGVKRAERGPLRPSPPVQGLVVHFMHALDLVSSPPSACTDATMQAEGRESMRIDGPDGGAARWDCLGVGNNQGRVAKRWL